MAGISCLVDELRDIKKDLSKKSLKFCKLIGISNLLPQSSVILVTLFLSLL